MPSHYLLGTEQKSLTMEFVPFCKQMTCALQMGLNQLGEAAQLAVQGGSSITLRKDQHP